MIIGIDASNIRVGGGVTHLVELLKATNPVLYGITRVIIWSNDSILNGIEDRPWIIKINPFLKKRNLLYRFYWKCYGLSRAVKQFSCVALLLPSGFSLIKFSPVVTMSQNMLPFEWRELRRFGWSRTTIKLLLVRWIQIHSFRRADGVIFLT